VVDRQAAKQCIQAAQTEQAYILLGAAVREAEKCENWLVQMC